MPNRCELHAYEGRYGSDGAKASAEVTAGDRGVAVRFGQGSRIRLELAAVSRDRFRRGAMTALFHRDEAGEVVAFSYSDPLLPGLRFTRLGDGAV